MLLFGRFAGLATAVLRMWLLRIGDDLLLFSLAFMDTTGTARGVTILIGCVVWLVTTIVDSVHRHCDFVVRMSQIDFSRTFVLRQWSFCCPEWRGKVATAGGAPCTAAGI
jgi:hypothetical protein